MYNSKVFQSKFTKALLMKNSNSLHMSIKQLKILKKLELLTLSKKHTFLLVERFESFVVGKYLCTEIINFSGQFQDSWIKANWWSNCYWGSCHWREPKSSWFRRASSRNYHPQKRFQPFILINEPYHMVRVNSEKKVISEMFPEIIFPR